jgi:hypothetical protein
MPTYSRITQPGARQTKPDVTAREDVMLSQAFRDIASRDYTGAYASLFKAHVLEKFDIARNTSEGAS